MSADVLVAALRFDYGKRRAELMEDLATASLDATVAPLAKIQGMIAGIDLALEMLNTAYRNLGQ